MNRFFPMPYPDESIYSIFVRYDEESGNDNYFATVKDLIGKMHSSINYTFVNGLDFLCKQLPESSAYTPEYFINNHTLLPLYKPFIPAKRYINAMNNLKNGNITSVLSGIGATSGSICKVVGFKYCVECIEEDKKTWEKAYLHRSHQVDGNFVCFKHNTHLQVFEPPKNDIFYNIHNMNIRHERIGLTKPSDELLNLAKDIDFVLLNHEKFESYEITREKYYSGLLERGYSSDKGLVEQVQLHSDFLNFYSNDFLSKLESIVDPYDESSWLRNISRRKLKTVNPIRNLLFIRFLFGGLNEFIVYKYQKVNSFKEYRRDIDNKTQKSVKAYKTELREPYVNDKIKLTVFDQ